MSDKIEKIRSNEMTDGLAFAGNRTLLYALGIGKEEMEKPFIGVVSSWSELHPGHKHFRDLTAAVKEGILASGGQPFEMNTIALCDGITQGHKGMCYVLPSRDLIADSVELVAEGQRLDGIVMVASCDKIVPAMAMAAGRLNIPAIIVTGGPMLPSYYKGREFGGAWEVREAGGKLTRGEISQEDYDHMEQCACGGVGSCPMIGTANTMSCLMEPLGLTLPGCGTSHAVQAEKLRYARDSGKRIIPIFINENFILRPMAGKRIMDVFLDGTFPQQCGKFFCFFLQMFSSNSLDSFIFFIPSVDKLREAYDDTAGVEIVI